MKIKIFVSVCASFLLTITILILLFIVGNFLYEKKYIGAKENLNEFQKSVAIDSLYLQHYGNLSSIQDSGFMMVSWNIEHGRYVKEQIEYLDKLNPDIICLQEVDWNNKRTQNTNIIEIISKELRMNSCYGIEFIEIDSENRKKYDYIGEGGGVVGNAILSRGPLFDCYRLALTTEYFDWQNPNRYTQGIINREPRIGQRIALLGSTIIGGKKIKIASTHLEDKGGGIVGRIAQFNQILAKFDRDDCDAAVIAGDLNTFAHGAALLIFGEANKDSMTLSKPFFEPEAVWFDQNIISKTTFSDPFDKYYDYTLTRTIFYRGKLDWMLLQGLQVIDKGMSPLKYSDHKAIWAKVEYN